MGIKIVQLNIQLIIYLKSNKLFIKKKVHVLLKDEKIF